MTDQATLKRSVKRHDVIDLANGGQAIILTPWSYIGADLMPATLPDILPANWRARDRVLRQTVTAEGMFGNAVAIAINQVVATDLHFEGGARLVARAKGIINNPRWSSKLKKWARDWLTQNNGYHGEVIRATNARGSRIMGVDHLDAIRCRRTGDPEEPIIYTDRENREHVLKWYQWFGDVDMESPSVEANGMGQCAAERAYQYIRQLAIVTNYIIQKTGGKKPLAIYLVSNLHANTLDAIIETAEADNINIDRVADRIDDDGEVIPPSRVGTYMGAIVGAIPTDKEPKVVKIDLAGLPDRFNSREEWDKCLLAYAKSMGIDIQELQPLSAGPLGTGQQSAMLHEKGKKSGMAAFKTSLRENLQEAEISSGTTVTWSDYDILDEIRKAELSKTRTDDVATLVEKQIITPEQALEVKVNYDELPATFQKGEDSTPDVTASSADGDIAPAPASE